MMAITITCLSKSNAVSQFEAEFNEKSQSLSLKPQIVLLAMFSVSFLNSMGLIYGNSRQLNSDWKASSCSTYLLNTTSSVLELLLLMCSLFAGTYFLCQRKSNPEHSVWNIFCNPMYDLTRSTEYQNICRLQVRGPKTNVNLITLKISQNWSFVCCCVYFLIGLAFIICNLITWFTSEDWSQDQFHSHLLPYLCFKTVNKQHILTKTRAELA
jgi:hypothetical protein